MSEPFKINIYFDENSEEIEKIISYLIIRKLNKVAVLSSIGRRLNA